MKTKQTEKEIKELMFLVANEFIKGSTAQKTAEKLYGYGYRKQRDTVEEFAEKVVVLIDNCTETYWKTMPNLYTRVYVRKPIIIDEIKQLAEQYGKEEKC